jgi:putative oxidoreductase
MSPTLQAYVSIAGRVLLASLFLLSGIGKVTGFEGTVGYIESKGLPLAEVGAAAAAVLEIAGALALILGWRTRWAALGLAVYSIATAFVFHNFWTFAPPQLVAQQVQFLKNICITGGLLTVLAWGPGSKSMDARTTDE